MVSRYTQRTDGEWIQIDMEGHKIRCCDCGLVHTLKFRMVDGKLQFQAVRNQRSTSQSRRKKLYPLIASERQTS